jgi:hypothetical protein
VALGAFLIAGVLRVVVLQDTALFASIRSVITLEHNRIPQNAVLATRRSSQSLPSAKGIITITTSFNMTTGME